MSEKPNCPRFAVVGHPVDHSLSPQIHQIFAQQAQIKLQYETMELFAENFITQVHHLRRQGLRGLNVTAPLKREAWELCDRKSPRADHSQAVNTLIFLNNGKIAGDNTDGIGLVRDLINNHQVLVNHRKILLLGAGGAARGVLPALLALTPESCTLANRNLEKAQELAASFRSIGSVLPCGYGDLGNEKFDLIINATSAGLNHQVPPLVDEALGINTICYDMMYSSQKNTAFVDWAEDRGASRAIDGLGMLVEQAAESFFIWHGIRVKTLGVVDILRQKYRDQL